MLEYRDSIKSTVNAVIEKLTPEEIADLESMFYIGRERQFCERYEEQFERTAKKHIYAGNLAIDVYHLMSKTNFLEELSRGIEILGRRRLASELRALRPYQKAD